MSDASSLWFASLEHTHRDIPFVVYFVIDGHENGNEEFFAHVDSGEHVDADGNPVPLADGIYYNIDGSLITSQRYGSVQQAITAARAAIDRELEENERIDFHT